MEATPVRSAKARDGFNIVGESIDNGPSLAYLKIGALERTEATSHVLHNEIVLGS
jgi:hypothetical protein